MAASAEFEDISSSTDNEIAFCGLKKKKSKKAKTNDKQGKKHFGNIIDENEKLNAEIKKLRKEKQELEIKSEEKDKRLLNLLEYTIKHYDISECDMVITGNGNTIIIPDGPNDVLEQLQICVEQICTDLKQSTSEQAKIAVQLQTVEKVVQDVHNKVSCLGIDNTGIQSKLGAIENLLDVAKSRKWKVVDLERGVTQIRNWLKIKCSTDGAEELGRLTYAILPSEGKRLVERLTAMYGNWTLKLIKVLKTSQNPECGIARLSSEHPEDICTECLARWIYDSDENDARYLQELLQSLDTELVQDQKEKLRQKYRKSRSFRSVESLTDVDSLSNNENLPFEDNYFRL